MLCIIEGGLGSGKTLLMVILSQYSKLPIVSNFEIKMDYEELDIHKFVKSGYDNCNIFLDEGYVYLDSRLSQKKRNRLMSYVLFQSRKKSVNIFITVQLRGSLDIRYRSLADYIISCQNKGNKFRYTIYRPNDPSYNASAIIPYEKALDYFKLYNTNEVIADFDSSFQFLSDQEKLEYAKEHADKFLKDWKHTYFSQHPKATVLKAPTKSAIRIWIVENELEMEASKILYDYVKSVLA